MSILPFLSNRKNNLLYPEWMVSLSTNEKLWNVLLIKVISVCLHYWWDMQRHLFTCLSRVCLYLSACACVHPKELKCFPIVWMNYKLILSNSLNWQLGQTILPVKEDFIIVNLHVVCANCQQAILSEGQWSCKQCRNFHICRRWYFHLFSFSFCSSKNFLLNYIWFGKERIWLIFYTILMV